MRVAVPAAVMALVTAGAVLAAFALTPESGAPPGTSGAAPQGARTPVAPDAVLETVEEAIEEVAEQVAPPPPPVRFLAWGDAGHGNPGQYATARAAERVCEDPGCDFVLMLGDNVYPDGLHGVDDPQIHEKFEAPYANLTVPFYVALGNHDVALGPGHGGGRDNGDHQVAYSPRSERWEMPARHYAFREGEVHVVVLDLTLVHGASADEAAARAQLDWLKGVWDEDAAWRVAVAHFPYVSNGKHGDAGEPLRRFLEEGVCGKAHLYLAGHDHHLEWLRPVPSCGATEFVVSGAASDPRPFDERPGEAYFGRGGTLGFFWFEANAERLVGRAYDAEGNVLFERALAARDAEARDAEGGGPG